MIWFKGRFIFRFALAGVIAVTALCGVAPAQVTVIPNDTVEFTASRQQIGDQVSVDSPTMVPPSNYQLAKVGSSPDTYGSVAMGSLDGFSVSKSPDSAGGFGAEAIVSDSAASHRMRLAGKLLPLGDGVGGGGGSAPLPDWTGLEAALPTASFSVEKVKVGLTDGGNGSLSKTVTCTITPKADADGVTITATNDKAEPTEVSRVDDGNSKVITVTIKAKNPSAAKEDCEVQAKKGGAVLDTLKVTVLRPKTVTHAVGNPSITNSSVAAADGSSDLTSKVECLVTLTIKDQFGDALDAIFDGNNLVQEKFTNINGAQGLLPAGARGVFGNIDVPDTALTDGVKSDLIKELLEININDPWGPGLAAAWSAFQFVPHNNIFAMSPNPATVNATMEVKCHGYDLTPKHKRTITVQNANAQPSPLSVTDQPLP